MQNNDEPEELVKLLKQGVASWNAWREKNPFIRPFLSGSGQTSIYIGHKARLSGADLSGANLIDAYLGGADLSGAGPERC